ncbi:MAG: hypothetical protein ABFS37_07080 [Acidobacteriota bacterium]
MKHDDRFFLRKTNLMKPFVLCLGSFWVSCKAVAFSQPERNTVLFGLIILYLALGLFVPLNGKNIFMVFKGLISSTGIVLSLPECRS